MGQTFKLAAKKRETSKHSARSTRAEARVPGVIYGHGTDPQSVSVDYSDFLRTYRKAGQAALIDLDVDGNHIKVVIQDYDLDPVQDTFSHIDFFAINPKETMTVHVPLLFVGAVAAPKMPSEEEDAAADEALAAAEAAEAGEGTEGGEAPEGEATE